MLCFRAEICPPGSNFASRQIINFTTTFLFTVFSAFCKIESKMSWTLLLFGKNRGHRYTSSSKIHMLFQIHIHVVLIGWRPLLHLNRYLTNTTKLPQNSQSPPNIYKVLLQKFRNFCIHIYSIWITLFKEHKSRGHSTHVLQGIKLT